MLYAVRRKQGAIECQSSPGIVKCLLTLAGNEVSGFVVRAVAAVVAAAVASFAVVGRGEDEEWAFVVEVFFGECGLG
jgi:hypothetical protein